MMAEDLEKEGVKVLLAGDISIDAINTLATHGIEVVPKCEGYSTALVKLFLAGK